MIDTLAPATSTLLPRDALARAAERARTERRPVLVSRTLRLPAVAPLDVFARAGQLAAERFYWERPADDLAIVGAGACSVVTAAGPDRFRAAGRAWRDLLARAILLDGEASQPGVGPLLVGGFAFSPAGPGPSGATSDSDATGAARWRAFPPGRLVLPRLTLTRAEGACWLVLNLLARPDADPEPDARRLEEDARRLWNGPDTGNDVGRQNGPATSVPAGGEIAVADDAGARERWKSLVAEAVGAIGAGAFEKVVLARAVDVSTVGAFAPDRIVRRLRAQEPDCAIFAVAQAGGCFVGATPEQLVRLRGDRLQVDCLAGTMRRGATPEDDRRAAQELLTSDKERAEHAVVVRMIRGALANACVELDAPSEPRLRLTRRVQHLHTPLAGRVAAGVDVLHLVERLHPTPAVGGAPRAAALDFIDAREGFERGWYAGPIGWVDRHGGGDFVVGIRSALLHGTADEAGAASNDATGRGDGGFRSARLFAGCGIVAGSRPERELDEAALKLQPMLAALRCADGA